MFLSTIRHASKPGAVLAALLVSVPAFAQGGPPDIDQYLVYKTQPHGDLGLPVLLRDQFSPNPTTHLVRDLQYFMNPVEKDAMPIVDPRLHYTWWHLPPQSGGGTVLATNKYGDQQIRVFASEFLLNPALKFPQPNQPIPVANHYLCYRAQGSIPPRPVMLHDQFGTWNAFLTGEVEWWCNPVEKQYQGVTDPIIRPDAHLVCYRIQVQQQPPGIPISFLDQFRQDTTQLTQISYLCVPTLKHDVTPTTSTSWGSIKATYR